MIEINCQSNELLDNISRSTKKTPCLLQSDIFTGTIHNWEWKVIPESFQIAFDSRKSLLNRVQIRWIRWQKNKLATCETFEQIPRDIDIQSIPASSSTRARTSSAWWMLQLSKIRMLRGPGYGLVRGIYLHDMSCNPRETWLKSWRTTRSWRNWKNCAELTDPGMMLYIIIPSSVRTGRIEYCCPRTKHLLCTHLFPTKDHPFFLPDVFLFCAA